MRKLRVVVGADRAFAGSITLTNERGKVLAGPFFIAASSSSVLAAGRGNSARDPLLRYGHTPLGVYRAVSFLEPARLASESYGAYGALLLRPMSGQCALAEANGRFRNLLHAGATVRRMRSTAGSLRMRDRNFVALIHALAGVDDLLCEVVEGAVADAVAVFDDPKYRADDPPPADRTQASRGVLPVERRGVLKGGMASTFFALGGGVTFFSAGAISQAYAQVAYGGSNGAAAPAGSAMEQLQNATNGDQATGSTFDNGHGPSDATPNSGSAHDVSPDTSQTGQDQTGQDQTGQDQTGQDQAGQDQAGQDQAGQDQAGQDQTNQDQNGQDQNGQDQNGQDQNGQDQNGQTGQQGNTNQENGNEEAVAPESVDESQLVQDLEEVPPDSSTDEETQTSAEPPPPDTRDLGDRLNEGHVEVEPTESSRSIWSKIGTSTLEAARDTELQTVTVLAEHLGARSTPEPVLTYLSPVAKLGAAAAAATSVYLEGPRTSERRSAAYDSMRESLWHVAPEVMSSSYAAALVPVVVEATVGVESAGAAVAAAAAAGTVATAGVAVAAVVVTVGATVVISMGVEKLAENGIRAYRHLISNDIPVLTPGPGRRR